jgi:hypothetical protein
MSALTDDKPAVVIDQEPDQEQEPRSLSAHASAARSALGRPRKKDRWFCSRAAGVSDIERCAGSVREQGTKRAKMGQACSTKLQWFHGSVLLCLSGICP